MECNINNKCVTVNSYSGNNNGIRFQLLCKVVLKQSFKKWPGDTILLVFVIVKKLSFTVTVGVSQHKHKITNL